MENTEIGPLRSTINGLEHGPTYAAIDGCLVEGINRHHADVESSRSRPDRIPTRPAIIALEKAFDYRGDVTLSLKDNSKIEGYIFDRGTGANLCDSYVRILPKDASPRMKISYANIAALAFTGKDPAAGKSWEAWVRKYWEKKGSGEGGARIDPESLE